MKTLILAGGYGTRISEESGTRPKPLIEIGGRPIIWHIMKHYAHYGHKDFVILLGYKGHLIKNYFLNYHHQGNSFTINLKSNQVETISRDSEDWNVTLLDTGIDTMTGGRIRQARELLGDEPFMLTYGDGVSDIDLSTLVESHVQAGKTLSMSAVPTSGKFGVLGFDDEGEVDSFAEKPSEGGDWINCGYFVCSPEIFNYLPDDPSTIFERAPLETLAAERQINCHRHQGFWKCMDTLADKVSLNETWKAGQATWKIWE